MRYGTNSHFYVFTYVPYLELLLRAPRVLLWGTQIQAQVACTCMQHYQVSLQGMRSTCKSNQPRSQSLGCSHLN